MSTIFNPMLAGVAPKDLNSLLYPVLVSPKLDGIRAIVLRGKLVSRNLKPIANTELRERYSHFEFSGLDGELIAGNPTAKDCFKQTQSVVSTREGVVVTDVFYHVFDDYLHDGDFYDRYGDLKERLNAKIVKVEHHRANSPDEVLDYERRWVGEGYEGLMIRSLDGPYKHGRSTTKEGWLLKLKRFTDAEAVVTGVEELMRNDNEATTDALGHTVRSSHKANKVGKGVMGALKVTGLNGRFKGADFSIGTGFNSADRKEPWEVGTVVKYKFFDIGADKAPRFPVFLNRLIGYSMKGAK